MQPLRRFIATLTPIMLGIAGCPSSTAEDLAPATLLITETHYQGVLFNEAEARRQRLDVLITTDNLQFWSPSVTDVARMEAQILPALLTNRQLSDGVGWEGGQPLEVALPNYTRQYFGYLTADGARIIYTSFFCDVPVENLTVVSAIADGGDCFFQIHYNIDTHEYFDLHVNGEA